MFGFKIMFDQAEDYYLKAMFHLRQELKVGVSTGSFSEKLKMKAVSVTGIIKRLADKK